MALCFPPTYECNSTTHQCYQVLPGHGTDLPDCQRQCQQSSTGTTGTTGHSTGTTGTTGSTGSTGHPQQQGYTCDPNSLMCVQSPSGSPKNECDAQCGKPQNVTPIFVIGNYRGLEIDVKYVKGEWQAKITTTDITIVDPTGQTWAKGVVRQYNNELWLVTPAGTRRGIFGLQQLPEVSVLTWTMGAFGQPPPVSFDAGLSNGQTFVFAKCINPNNCQWHLFQALAQLKSKQDQWKNKREKELLEKADPVDDPCSKYPDCHSCIKAPEQCGWCSVPVYYIVNNSSIPGKNCAGLNTTITPRINCTGSFSTKDCTNVTTGQSTGMSTGQTTGSNQMYYCDPINATCSMSKNGTLPPDVCKAQCTVNPIPPIIQNTFWRGLQIDTSYKQGEWRAHFTTNSVTVVSPDGTVIQGNVTTTSDYLTISTPTGAYQTLWQFQPGPAVDNFSWAWGTLGGQPPTSFDQAMTTPGQKEFWLVTCHAGAPTTVCDFSK
jgi:hypothetical protein